MADADIDSMSLKDLKALIAKAGLSSADCLDKADLRARAREATERLASAPASGSSSNAASGGVSSNTDAVSNKTMGGYPCIIKGPADLIDGSGAPADLVIVVLHGLGATNSDLVDVPGLLRQFEPSLGNARLLQIFPQAPQTAIGTAWWTFDVMGFMQAGMTGDNNLIAQLIRKKPADLDACREHFDTLLTEARTLGAGGKGGADGVEGVVDRPALPMGKVLLAGFSLGAITSLDLALHQPAGASPAGVLFMNGAPICVDDWAAALKKHPGLRVHMTAGQADMTLPAAASGWVKQLLDANGADATLDVHPGGHEVGGAPVLRKIAGFVKATLDKAAAP